ncbi:hypothetical protein [Niabella ginsengisoli]|uniref:Uncharacterized protein n=1 Tax=Niabella ginsengisoli TaxID=522298 RepID=A0ABS9SL87_9BACT|nr:hypothetical protein [Niabella ginsengisoli]MCH5599153.1 hypothetical protein [Niabella ginsengisoli]
MDHSAVGVSINFAGLFHCSFNPLSAAMALHKDMFESPDYYNLDELLSEEQLMIREAVRTYVKKKLLLLLKTIRNVLLFRNKL